MFVLDAAIVKSMRIILSIGLVGLLSVASGAADAVGPDVAMLTIAQRNHAEGDMEITSAGLFSTRQGTAAHFDLVQYKEPARKDTWAAEFGVGYLLPTQIPLFIGAGVVGGYRRDREDYFATWYPEAGLVVPLIPGVAVSASAKRYQRLHQERVDVLMLGIALTMK